MARAAFLALSLDAPTGSVHYLVSSEHLKMPSPVFTRMLLGADGSSDGLEPDRGHYITIDDDCDEQAMLVLLNIIHLRNRQVPRSVDLEMMTKVAVLINHYKCHEEAEAFTSMWIVWLEETSSPPPNNYCRELILWLCIACIFRLEKIFFDVTATAIKLGADGYVRTMGLPIPASVTGRSLLFRLMNVLITCREDKRQTLRLHGQHRRHSRTLRASLPQCQIQMLITS